jgi:hypothetical protein
MASIIASQAIISGCFSMTQQAMQLGWLPVYQFRHVRFGRQIRYLARFLAKWNELGREGVPLP